MKPNSNEDEGFPHFGTKNTQGWDTPVAVSGREDCWRQSKLVLKHHNWRNPGDDPFKERRAWAG